MSYDGVFPGGSTQPTAYERHSSLKGLASGQLDEQSHDNADSTNKKPWNLMKLFGGQTGSSGNEQNRPSSARPLSRASSVASKGLTGHRTTSNSSNPSLETDSPPDHGTFSFKFSLEWVYSPESFSQPRRLHRPQLPLPAEMALQSARSRAGEIRALKPIGPLAGTSKYAGRALAEWALVVNECQNFFDRRKSEGVPANRLVETPTLGVESFRRPG